jgi:diadenosine tetraphosphatase ApaH/serine/threonine PP2A family protein phosphatase
MRVAILADIHSNVEALTECLRAVERLKAGRIVCLGDIVGYGASPNPCCELIRSSAEVVLLGDHDAQASSPLPCTFEDPTAREALEWTRTALSEENRAWLSGLAHYQRTGNVAYSHASPVDPKAFDHLRMLAQIRALSASDVQSLADLSFIGHSHLYKVFTLGNGEVTDVVAKKFNLRRGYKYIVAAGSVGQPRDFDPRASFVVFDSDAQTVECVRVEYDVETSAQKISEARLPPALGKRLLLGS